MASTQARRDFGSFFSSNIQELVSVPEDEYVPPTLAVSQPSFTHYRSGGFEFGRACKDKHFFLEENCTFINHGAFGGVLKEAVTNAQAWQIYVERQPLRYFDRELFPLLAYVTRRMANFVGCDPRDLVLVSNVTTAVNSIIRSQNLLPGDTVLTLSLAYGAVKKIVQQFCLEKGAKWKEQTISLPIEGEEQILNTLEQGLDESVKLVVVDHIPSNTGFIMPVADIIKLCHSRGIKILIDGAHALGQVQLDLKGLGADYYTTNAHKWFCGSKGAAIMYVDRQHQNNIRPLLISHGYGSGFSSEFVWTGQKDYSPFLSLLTVLDFWVAIGPAKIIAHNYNLAKQAGELLKDKWNTSLLAPAKMFGSFSLIELPPALYEGCDVKYSTAEIIQNALYHQFNIEVPVKSLGGRLYARISAQMYNYISEYEKLADAILQLTSQSQELFRL